MYLRGLIDISDQVIQDADPVFSLFDAVLYAKKLLAGIPDP